ncbi:MAG TPA: hypothetical protein DCX41_05105 [Aequorivita sp.]|nr:hypothetical protein [Pusillimonas sp.]HAV54296.1 hypothetical protein [Aequorivita sp.]|tara:strand:- start:2864 stop:3472 length:609 start_codon:yes stop_codon:yes gene_type:complete
MNIKQRKLILHFLKQLQEILDRERNGEINEFFKGFFDRGELIEILEYFYTAKDLQGQEIDTLEYRDLLELLGEDMVILSFLIKKIEEGITAVPKMEQDEINRFFDDIGLGAHYLRDKPVEEWDGYDRSNYYSLLRKHGKTKRVFAIFTSDVKSDDKYAVTTKPFYFFDTKQEAEKELEKIIAEGHFTEKDLVIHSLWHLTQN